MAGALQEVRVSALRIERFLKVRPNLMRHPCTQGAVHTMSECPNTPKNMAHELRVGFILCRKQESYCGMSKSKAKDLMQEVCNVLFLLLHLSQSPVALAVAFLTQATPHQFSVFLPATTRARSGSRTVARSPGRFGVQRQYVISQQGVDFGTCLSNSSE